jgi:TonB-dependent starch-binding outer membrane protein SusC
MNFKRLLAVLMVAIMGFSLPAIAQDKTIVGKVTDKKDGSPLANVSVVVKGSKVGTQTAADGSFKLKVPAGTTTISISSVGFATQEVAIGAGDVIVALSSSDANLNEVIVVGYGTQRKKDVTGAIAKVSSEKINSIAAPSFEAALQGKAPGVQVIQGSGLAGSSSVIRIRGVGSISAGGDPLYVIDGFPITVDNFTRGNTGAMNQNPLAALNPNDIESVEVLKDAAASGIFGSRGANGVILITTKRGKAGKIQLNYSNKIGVQNYANRPDFVNSEEWLQLRQEAWENDGNTGQAPIPGGITLAQAKSTNTDWWDLLTRTGFINEHNLSMTVGNKWIRNYIGATYSNNQSYLKNNQFVRTGINYNAEITAIKKLKISLKNSFYVGDNHRVPAAWAGGLGDAMSTALPFFSVYNANGTYFTGGANPVRRLNETKWRNTDYRYIAGLNLDYEIIKNLNARVSGNFETYRGIDDQWESIEWLNTTSFQGGKAQRSKYGGQNWLVNFTLNYNLNLGVRHRLNFLGGVEIQERNDKDLGYVARDGVAQPFWKEKQLYNRLYDSTKAATEAAGNQFINERYAETFRSAFIRANYSLDNKYTFQASARVDGSSKFGQNNKYGFFPTVSFGWTLSEERFLKNINWINFIKFRASYGITGNSNIPSSQYLATFVPGAVYNGGGTIFQRNVGDSSLRWETMTNMDLGIDFSLFKGRITGEIAYFNKVSTNILLEAGLAPSTGFDKQFRNIDNSQITNRGIEVSLNFKIVEKENLKFSIGGNLTSLYNRLDNLGTLSADAAGGGTNDTRVAVGYPIGTNFLVRYAGVDPLDGLPIWLDKTGKTTKTFSLNNRVPVGSVNPDAIGSINHSLVYKNFEFSSLFTYTIGGNIYDASGKRQAGVVTDWNIRRDNLDRWQKPGDNAKYPRLTMNPGTYDGLTSEWQYNSTLFLYDASFVRLRELTFAYRITGNTAKKLGIRNARIFLTGMNLLTFSKYPGGDPEIARDFENATDRNLSPNITYLTPPQPKSFIFGVNVNF